MIKTRLHIKSADRYMDRSLFVNAELPFIPRKGELLCLTLELIEELEAIVRNDIGIAERYIKGWSGFDHVTSESMLSRVEFQFDVAIMVNSVLYKANSEIVHIELAKEPDPLRIGAPIDSYSIYEPSLYINRYDL